MTAIIPPDTRLKVGLLVQANQYGGGSRQSLYILEELVRQGFDAFLITNAGNTSITTALAERALPVKVHATPVIKRSINPFRELASLWYLIRTLRAERPQIILSAGVKLIALGGLAGFLARVPTRVAIIRGQGAPPDTLHLKIVFAIEWFLAAIGTRFITVCDYDRAEMIEKGICAPDRAVTVHNGTDVENLADLSSQRGLFRAHQNIPPDAFVIGMVGRFYRQKSYDRFIIFMQRLCSRFPHVRGVLIGDGPLRDELQAQIDSTGYADRITITGYVPDMRTAYADIDLSVLFTEYEGCANALLESGAAGLAAITEDVCGNAEIVIHEQTGYVVAKGDIEAAAQAAERLIGDEALRSALGVSAKTNITNNFNQLTQVGRLVERAGAFHRQKAS